MCVERVCLGFTTSLFCSMLIDYSTDIVQRCSRGSMDHFNDTAGKGYGAPIVTSYAVPLMNGLSIYTNGIFKEENCTAISAK